METTKVCLTNTSVLDSSYNHVWSAPLGIAWQELRKCLNVDKIEYVTPIIPLRDLDFLNRFNDRVFCLDTNERTVEIASDGLEYAVLAIIDKDITFPRRFETCKVGKYDGFKVEERHDRQTSIFWHPKSGAWVVHLFCGKDVISIVKSNGNTIKTFEDVISIANVPPTYVLPDALSDSDFARSIQIRIPNVALDRIQQHSELLGELVRPQGAKMTEAESGIRYKLNSIGSELLSYGYLGYSGDGGETEVIEFTPPFYILQSKLGCPPYLSIAVHNDALLRNEVSDAVDKRIAELRSRMFH